MHSVCKSLAIKCSLVDSRLRLYLLFIIFIPSILKEHTSWANQLLKKGKRRPISDIRRSIGDGQTLVYILETLGR